MARIPYLTESDVPPAVAELLAKVPPLNVFGLLAHAESAFRPWLRLGDAILSELALDPALRELAILRVGHRCARYEWEQHVPIARDAGVPDEVIAALERDEPDALPDGERRVVAFVDGVIDGEMDDAVYAAVAERLPRREVVELALTAAQYLMLARMMATFRIDPDPPAGPGPLLRR